MTSFEHERDGIEHSDVAPAPPTVSEPDPPAPPRSPHAPAIATDAAGSGTEPQTVAETAEAASMPPCSDQTQVDQANVPPVSEPPPATERPTSRPLPPGPEARIELFHSHAFTYVAGILQSFGEEFHHVSFDGIEDGEMLSDEYENSRFHVTYCLREQHRDELRVRYGPISGSKHSDAELLALARQLAHLLGGGTNLRLVDNRGRRR